MINLNELIEQQRQHFVRENLLSDSFLDFTKKNLAPFETLLTYYNCAMMEVETKFRVLDEEYRLEHERDPIESIQTRIKTTDSLLRKIRKNNIPLSIDAIEKSINDIAGVRVICSFLEDVYMLADCLLKQDDVTLIQAKDYIKNPKPSGYRSLHLIVSVPIFLRDEKRNVKVEVQIRTLAMDNWASLDHKLRYKKNIPDEEMKKLEDELRECAEMSAELDKRMQTIRSHYWQDDEEITQSSGPILPGLRFSGLLQAAGSAIRSQYEEDDRSANET